MAKDPVERRKYFNEYYKQRRDEVLVKLGGKCVVCSSIEKLEIDHIDPKTKTDAVSRLISNKSAAAVEHELQFCQLLCHECHKKKTLKDAGKQDAKNMHGTISSYRYCRCAVCKKAQSDYMRALYLRRKARTNT